jgi:hypothetical protein
MVGKATWRQQLRSFFSWGYRFTPPIEPAVKIELPLTPTHVHALRHHVRSQRQLFLGATAAATTVALLLAVHAVGVRPSWFVLLLAITGCFAGFGYLMDWLGWRRGHEAELRAGVYYRASGPIRIYRGRDTGRIEVGDVKIHYISSAICASLRELPFGYVDYAPLSRLVIEQRDADGEVLYRFPAYRPDDDPTVTRRLPSLMKPIIWGAGLGAVFVLAMLALGTGQASRR